MVQRVKKSQLGHSSHTLQLQKNNKGSLMALKRARMDGCP